MIRISEDVWERMIDGNKMLEKRVHDLEERLNFPSLNEDRNEHLIAMIQNVSRSEALKAQAKIKDALTALASEVGYEIVDRQVAVVKKGK